MEDLTVDSKDSLAPHVALLAVQLMFGSAPILGKFALVVFPSSAIVGFRVGGAALAFVFCRRFAAIYGWSGAAIICISPR